jgi:hypothetical protein
MGILKRKWSKIQIFNRKSPVWGLFYAGNRLHAFSNPKNAFLTLIQGRSVLKRKSKLAVHGCLDFRLNHESSSIKITSASSYRELSRRVKSSLKTFFLFFFFFLWINSNNKLFFANLLPQLPTVETASTTLKFSYNTNFGHYWRQKGRKSPSDCLRKRKNQIIVCLN